MNSGKRIALGITLIFLGWLSLGLGYGASLGGHPFNTIVFLLGFVFIISGIIILSSRRTKKLKEKSLTEEIIHP
ncbi:hypothetical protein [Adhaeribacter rhizoryzae]|uniref:Uncharacterized protein n=1 Tax=Adhaeribacter rhizoryzae TaxID=2607907 RepID=A0A5M6DDJ7_9BACT|nr:hypothetical protein [Adhaeribacter rhizoryzae]KAA5545637.1 hypothetical protein F0145_11905 [Adhaeribacter rhizoryzae]